MAYTTNQQLIDRVGTETAAQLTTESGDTPDADKVTAAREGAEGVVNSHLAPRYRTPVDLSVNAETSQVITKLVLDLAEHDLRSLRPPVNEDVVRKRAEAIKLLEKYHDGRASLPGLLPLAAPTSGGTVAQVDGATRIFSREKADGF